MPNNRNHLDMVIEIADGNIYYYIFIVSYGFIRQFEKTCWCIFSFDLWHKIYVN